MVDGHPITIGLFPGSSIGGLTIAFVKDAPYPVASEVLKGTGFLDVLHRLQGRTQ